MEKLAILGGEKEINFKFQRFNHIGKEEKKANKTRLLVEKLIYSVLKFYINIPNIIF